MTNQLTPEERLNMVGPVLTSSSITDAIVEAIELDNEKVVIEDYGSYRRVLVPNRCVVTKATIEKVIGRPFRFPGELETVLSTFKGRINLSEQEASWQS